MPNRPVLIDTFIAVPGIAEIIGIGGVRQPRGEAQEVEVEVIVASNLGSSKFDPAQDVSVHWIGCGQLDLLVPGSRWREGKRVGLARGRTVEAKFERAWREKVGTGVHPQPLGRPFPSSLFAGVGGLLLRRFRAETEPAPDRGDPDLVLLPPMELLRALFGMSNGFLLEMFDGIRNPAVSGERGLISRRLSHLREDGTVVLEAGRDLSRDEAIIAAAIVTDDAIRKLHDAAFQQLSVDPEARAGRSTQLTLKWPWSTPVPIRLVGRWVKRTDGPARFIASRIEAIGLPLSFKRVEVRHPGSPKGACEDLPPPDGRTRPANARLVVLTTGRAASTVRRPAEVGTGTLDLTTAKDIEVVSVACGGNARRDRAGIGEEPRDAAPFGSGGRQPLADPEVGAAVVKRKSGPGETPDRPAVDALRMTWKALQSACASRGWTLRAMLKPGRAFGEPAHGGFDFAREPLVGLVVDTTGKRLLVVDRGSPTGDECSLGLLVPKDEVATMTDAALAAAARRACTSVDGRWRSRMLHQHPPREFRVTAVNRDARVWQSCDKYAAMLARRLASVLGS